jgi:hypothetical protein
VKVINQTTGQKRYTKTGSQGKFGIDVPKGTYKVVIESTVHQTISKIVSNDIPQEYMVWKAGGKRVGQQIF